MAANEPDENRGLRGGVEEEEDIEEGDDDDEGEEGEEDGDEDVEDKMEMMRRIGRGGVDRSKSRDTGYKGVSGRYQIFQEFASWGLESRETEATCSMILTVSSFYAHIAQGLSS
eukprot:732125-Hanusia_phi.AAC.2